MPCTPKSKKILEHTKSNDEEFCKEREKYFIRKLGIYDLGINKECWIRRELGVFPQCEFIVNSWIWYFE